VKNVFRYVGVSALSALVVAVAMHHFLVVPRDADIDRLQKRADAAESDLAHYERVDTRAELRAASGAVDYQAWAQEQPEYLERVNGVECLVLRVGKDQWKVRKRRVGGNMMLALDSGIGGPAACDRLH